MVDEERVGDEVEVGDVVEVGELARWSRTCLPQGERGRGYAFLRSDSAREFQNVLSCLRSGSRAALTCAKTALRFQDSIRERL